MTAASLGKLRAVFKSDGSTTAGNSSQVSDGAAVVLLMTRAEAARRGLPVLATFRSFAAVGVDPAIMGIGPAVAIPAAVAAAGITVDDVDVFELNEAFASQVKREDRKRERGVGGGKRTRRTITLPLLFASSLQATYCAQKLNLDDAKVNPNGGAIALGHPLGATGARCTATLLHEMVRRGPSARFGVVSMCIGSGMGAAAVFERGSDDAFVNAAPVKAHNLLSADAVV